MQRKAKIRLRLVLRVQRMRVFRFLLLPARIPPLCKARMRVMETLAAKQNKSVAELLPRLENQAE
jgi:hypothetical protein